MGIMNRGQRMPNRESLTELRRQSARLEQVSRALVHRDRQLFDMVRKAIESNDGDRATIYANELSRVRNIKRILIQSQLAIDCIMIRIENFMDLCSVVEEMQPISEVIRDVSGEVQEVMPQFSSVINQLHEVTGEALIETRLDLDQPELEGALSATSREGAEILGQASEAVELSLMESFPEPPLIELTREAEAVAYGEPSGDGGKNRADISDEVVELIDVAHARRRQREALA